MARYHPNQRWNNLANAAGHMVFNPFAQLTRIADPGPRAIPFDENAPQYQRFTSSITSSAPEPAAKRQRTTPTMLPARVPNDDDEDMETAVNMIEPMRGGGGDGGVTTLAARGGPPGSGTPGGGGLKETPITLQQHHFGLPDTRTVVLTQTSYLAVIPQDTNGATTIFQLRLNTPVDWFATTGLATAVPGAAFGAGLYTNRIPVSQNGTWPASTQTFPNVLSASERPQWRTYWEKHYTYYTVLGCEYTLTFLNPQTNFNADQVVATFMDSYSATNATNIHPTTATLQVMEHWPDVKFRRVSSAGDGNMSRAYETIKGYYRPGTMRSSVENDEDIKTWTKVGSLPSLTELLTVCVAKAWDNSNATTGLNVRMDMRWIVQYKDLQVNFRWPAGQTAVTVSAPADIVYTS